MQRKKGAEHFNVIYWIFPPILNVACRSSTRPPRRPVKLVPVRAVQTEESKPQTRLNGAAGIAAMAVSEVSK
eukprot:scaffold5787_cov32-Prasinocladus_malaysianus.AAC.1